MSQDKDEVRRDKRVLVEELKSAGAVFKSDRSCTCPFHDDRTPSMSFYCAGDGAWKAKCHGCGFHGDVFDVRARREGRTPDDLLREHREQNTSPSPQQRPQRVYASMEELLKGVRRVEAFYPYSDPESGKVEAVVVRTRDENGKKSFEQAKAVDGGFVRQGPPKPWPLFNRARVAKAKTVIVVEGEKCVKLATAAYEAAGEPSDTAFTTSMGGAGKADHANWKPLAGKKVILWPDNDEAGIAHMKRVARLLERLDPLPEVHWLEPAELGLDEAGDIEEWLEAYGKSGDAGENRKAIGNALLLSRAIDGAAEFDRVFEQTVAGKRQAIEWPWKHLGIATQALLPQTTTVICGEPGSGKSFAMMEAAMFWHENQERIAMFVCEEKREWHLNRALALASGNGNVTSARWLNQNAEEAMALKQKHRKFLGSFAACIHTPASRVFTMRDLIDWSKRQADAGVRILVIDPVTAAKVSERRWIDDHEFVMSMGQVLDDHEDCRLILVTHPKGGRRTGPPSLNDLAGGVAYQNFTQNVFLLQRHDSPVAVRRFEIDHSVSSRVFPINRSWRLFKTRNGFGAGHEIGCLFNANTLRLEEVGIVAERIKSSAEAGIRMQAEDGDLIIDNGGEGVSLDQAIEMGRKSA